MRHDSSRRLRAFIAVGITVSLAASAAPSAARASNRTYHNPAAQAWVERIFSRLAAVSGRPRSAFSLTLVDDTQVNAFAGPRGDVHVTRALLGLVTSDDELAAVLGHEMAHITRGHLRKLQYTQIGTSLLAGVVAAATQSETAAELGRIGANLATLKFSRKEEQEADDTGMETMVRAGFNPRGMVSMLQKLEKCTGSAPALEFLQNHPDTANRIKRAQVHLARFKSGELNRPMAFTFGSLDPRFAAPVAANPAFRMTGVERITPARPPLRSRTEAVRTEPNAWRYRAGHLDAGEDDSSGWEPHRMHSGEIIYVKRRPPGQPDSAPPP